MEKELCRYAVWDIKTGILLIGGVKFKNKISLSYVESFRSICTRLRKIDAYERYTCIKGRSVQIAYWFNIPKDTVGHFVSDAGLVLGLR